MNKLIIFISVILSCLCCGNQRLPDKLKRECNQFNDYYDNRSIIDSFNNMRMPNLFNRVLADTVMFCSESDRLNEYFTKTGNGFYDFFFNDVKNRDGNKVDVTLMPFKRYKYYKLIGKTAGEGYEFVSRKVNEDFLVFCCPGANLLIDKKNKAILVFALLYQQENVNASTFGALFLVDENLMPYVAIKRVDFEQDSLVVESYKYSDEMTGEITVARATEYKKMNLKDVIYSDIIGIKRQYESGNLKVYDTCSIINKFYFYSPMWVMEHGYKPLCK